MSRNRVCIEIPDETQAQETISGVEIEPIPVEENADLQGWQTVHHAAQ